MTFNEAYDQLNDAQRRAVDEVEGPVMVVAGPGTGKTQILILRIANILLKTDTPASGILALTFTDAGAGEMKRRLRDIIGPRADEVRIHTYHGFAASVISEFDDHFPHLSRFKQIDDIEAETLVREILKDNSFSGLRPAGDPEFYVSKIISTIGDCKKEAWTPEIIRAFAADEIERIKKDEDSVSTRGPTKGKLKAESLKRIEKCDRTILFARAYEAYESRKREGRKVDFDDLIIELISTLKKDELLLRLLQERFLYFLIDEHQDTNDAQNLVIRLIADFFESPNLFVVGDEKQAIYRFQGASVENFLRFHGLYGSMKTIPLELNYRSHQNILDASFAMIENNYQPDEHADLRVHLKSGAVELPRPVELVMAGNTEAGDSYLVAELRSILNDQASKTVAIITRTNKDAQRVLTLLEQNNIPASAQRGADVFTHPLGVLFFALMEFLADPSQIEALAKCIAGGLWNLDIESRAMLIRSIRSGKIGEVVDKIPALENLRKEISQRGAIEFLTFAGHSSGITAMAIREPLAAEVWRSIISLARELASRGSADDPSRLVGELLSYRTAAGSRNIKIGVGLPDSRIRIMTAHGAKGLEFDNVFLPYATEESWLSRARGSYFILPREPGTGDEIRDARRLFYVAVTRARSRVCAVAALEEGQGKPLTPLRFLAELDPKVLARIDLPAITKDISGKPVSLPENQRTAECVAFAKKALMENGLSVTALNHFIKCPREFFYKSILKLPEPPAASAEKGNAMHEALSEVWRSQDRSEKNISATIARTVRTFFAGSFLPLFEKEPAVEELISAAPIVATAMAGHFAQTGSVSTEKWMERVLEGKYQDEMLSLKIHGKLDVLIENNNSALVFDYKTREALSVNAIKGETKASDGNYFRQLIFYKILLEGNSRFRGKTIEPALVFVKPDSKGRCPTIMLAVEKADMERVKKGIQELIESVWSGKFLIGHCPDKGCEYCALRNLMN